MPLYDYRCTECGREVEVMHSIGATGPATCETCGAAMRKALSSPAIHFKGSGWAKKDAAASAKKAQSKVAPSSSTSPESSDKSGGGAKSGAAETTKDSTHSSTSASKDGASKSAKGD